jgi:hypothetical protein
MLSAIVCYRIDSPHQYTSYAFLTDCAHLLWFVTDMGHKIGHRALGVNPLLRQFGIGTLPEEGQHLSSCVLTAFNHGAPLSSVNRSRLPAK